MRADLIIAAAVVALVGLVLVQRADLRATRAERDAALDHAAEVELVLDSARRVAEAERAAAARAEAEAVKWANTARELGTMEGRDAILSDHLRDAAGRVFRP